MMYFFSFSDARLWFPSSIYVPSSLYDATFHVRWVLYHKQEFFSVMCHYAHLYVSQSLCGCYRVIMPHYCHVAKVCWDNFKSELESIIHTNWKDSYRLTVIDNLIILDKIWAGNLYGQLQWQAEVEPLQNPHRPDTNISSCVQNKTVSRCLNHNEY